MNQKKGDFTASRFSIMGFKIVDWMVKGKDIPISFRKHTMMVLAGANKITMLNFLTFHSY